MQNNLEVENMLMHEVFFLEQNDTFEPNTISSFELRYALMSFVLKYCKKHAQEQQFETVFNKFVVIEAIIDPYNLVQKIDKINQ